MLPILVPGSFLVKQEDVPRIWGDTKHVYQHLSLGADYISAENLAGLQAQAIEVFGPGHNDHLRIELPFVFSQEQEEEEEKGEEDKKKKKKKKKKNRSEWLWKGLCGFYAIGTKVDKGLMQELAALPSLEAITELSPLEDLALCDVPEIFANCKRLELCGMTPVAKVIQVLKKCQRTLQHFVYHYAGRTMEELWMQWSEIAQQLCQTRVSVLHLHLVQSVESIEVATDWKGLYLLYNMPCLHHVVISNGIGMMRVHIPRLPKLLSLQLTGFGPYSYLFQRSENPREQFFHLRIPSHLLSFSTAIALRDRVGALELIDNPVATFELDSIVSWIRPERRLISVPPPDPVLSHVELAPMQFKAPEETQLVVTCQWPWTAICRHFAYEDLKGGRIYAPYVEWDDMNQESEWALLRYVQPCFLMVRAPLPRLCLPSVQEVIYLQQPITSKQLFRLFPNLRKLYIRQNQWHMSQLTRMRQHCLVVECL